MLAGSTAEERRNRERLTVRTEATENRSEGQERLLEGMVQIMDWQLASIRILMGRKIQDAHMAAGTGLGNITMYSISFCPYWSTEVN